MTLDFRELRQSGLQGWVRQLGASFRMGCLFTYEDKDMMPLLIFSDIPQRLSSCSICEWKITLYSFPDLGEAADALIYIFCLSTNHTLMDESHYLHACLLSSTSMRKRWHSHILPHSHPLTPLHLSNGGKTGNICFPKCTWVWCSMSKRLIASRFSNHLPPHQHPHSGRNCPPAICVSAWWG